MRILQFYTVLVPKAWLIFIALGSFLSEPTYNFLILIMFDHSQDNFASLATAYSTKGQVPWVFVSFVCQKTVS